MNYMTFVGCAKKDDLKETNNCFNKEKDDMVNLQKEFLEFHDEIKLDDENDILRHKRDILLKKLKNNISSQAAAYSHFNQGSYAMGTGIKPEKGDFDIDVGLIFGINRNNYPDPIEPKRWVRDALYGHTQNVEIRKSCVTVTYKEEGEDAYHVDFAVYAGDNHDGNMYIAKGKDHSSLDNKGWEISCPKELIDKINSKFSNKDDRAQFKRCIRYLKKWKTHKFSSDGNGAPTGISLTILAYRYFSVSKEYDYVNDVYIYNDFKAFSSLIQSITSKAFSYAYDYEDKCAYHNIKLELIVAPYNDLFEKMTAKQKEDFYNKAIGMQKILKNASNESKKNKACEQLQKLWGDSFPIKYDRSLVGTSESA